MRKLGQPFIWLRRFRYRCGYGVHSPFAFDFITNVIYEKTPYYAYHDLELSSTSHWKKANRLLFRLVNRVQPATIVDAGSFSDAARYLRAAKRNAIYIPVAEISDLCLGSVDTVDLLYLHHSHDPAFVREILNACVSRATLHSVFVIEGIYASSEMKSIWEQFQKDNRAGISFDLYYFGIIFFDTSKIKQHYKVNF